MEIIFKKETARQSTAAAAHLHTITFTIRYVKIRFDVRYILLYNNIEKKKSESWIRTAVAKGG